MPLPNTSKRSIACRMALMAVSFALMQSCLLTIEPLLWLVVSLTTLSSLLLLQIGDQALQRGYLCLVRLGVGRVVLQRLDLLRYGLCLFVEILAPEAVELGLRFLREDGRIPQPLELPLRFRELLERLLKRLDD